MVPDVAEICASLAATSGNRSQGVRLHYPIELIHAVNVLLDYNVAGQNPVSRPGTQAGFGDAYTFRKLAATAAVIKIGLCGNDLPDGSRANAAREPSGRSLPHSPIFITAAVAASFRNV